MEYNSHLEKKFFQIMLTDRKYSVDHVFFADAGIKRVAADAVSFLKKNGRYPTDSDLMAHNSSYDDGFLHLLFEPATPAELSPYLPKYEVWVRHKTYQVALQSAVNEWTRKSSSCSTPGEFSVLKREIDRIVFDSCKDVDTRYAHKSRAFKTERMNDTMATARKLPMARRLCGDFLFEDDVLICFASNGAGKSVFCLQMMDNIARGCGMEGFEVDSAPQPVLYIDCELKGRQQAARNGDKTFSDNLYRSERIPSSNDEWKTLGYTDWTDYMCDTIMNEANYVDAKVVCIDNIGYLTTGDMAKAEVASQLAQKIRDSAAISGITVVLVAHTPKKDIFRAITKNDLAGSARLQDYADGLMSIGRVVGDRSKRYCIHLKSRMVNPAEGERVALCTMIGDGKNAALEFKLEGWTQEFELIKTENIEKEQKNLDMDRVAAYMDQGLSSRDVADKMGTMSHKYWNDRMNEIKAQRSTKASMDNMKKDVIFSDKDYGGL